MTTIKIAIQTIGDALLGACALRNCVFIAVMT